MCQCQEMNKRSVSLLCYTWLLPKKYLLSILPWLRIWKTTSSRNCGASSSQQQTGIFTCFSRAADLALSEIYAWTRQTERDLN